jgi:hypothetical protein
LLLDHLGEAEIELHEYSREIPLEVEREEFSLKNTKKGAALVCFSRRQVLETDSRLQRYGHSVSMIYGSMPPETRKKQIQLFNRVEERERYELIRGTKIEARFSLMDLYGFLHLPFSGKEPGLTQQWLETVEAIAEGREVPEPVIKTGNLEELELRIKR